MLTISTEILHDFDSRIEDLRISTAAQNDLSTKDFIDDMSIHFILLHNFKIIGSVRISSSTHSILQHWADNQFPFYQDSNKNQMAELTKGYIAKDYQNKGLYKLAMLEILLRLPKYGYTKACSAVRVSFPHRGFLQSLGFVEYEKTILFHDTDACFEVIPICLDKIDYDCIAKNYFSHVKLLKSREICVTSNLLEIN